MLGALLGPATLFKYSCILGGVLSCGFLEAGPIPLHAGYVDYWRYSYLRVAFAILFCRVDRVLLCLVVHGVSLGDDCNVLHSALFLV